MVKCLLCVEGMRDDPAPDGTTGFALSLAQLNKNQSLAILESGIEPRDEILFLAQRISVIDASGPDFMALQVAVKSVLDRVPQLFNVQINIEDTIDERCT